MLARQFIVAGLLGSLTVAAVANAQYPAATIQRPYDGIQAGLDAFRLAEARRQSVAVQQLALNDQFRFWAGVGSVPVLLPASREYAYAYGRVGYRPLTVFEPWPFVPGDIYGYAFYNPIRQPVSQVQAQTGPNRWESHPVYDPPLIDYRPLPLVDSALLVGTPYSAPRPSEPAIESPAPPAVSPPAAAARTPREY